MKDARWPMSPEEREAAGRAISADVDSIRRFIADLKPFRCAHHFHEDSSRARGGRCRRHRCDVEACALCPGWDHCPRQGQRAEKGRPR